MALFIKSVGMRFMVKAGLQLKELPSEHQWTSNLDKVSLMNNSFLEISPHISPKCHNLSTLLLQKNVELERVPENFFEHIHGLKNLDLSYTRISNLPDSISNLENLVALVLRNCDKLRYVCSLAKLNALRKLDLFNTAIKEVPLGIEMLTNLTYLSLYSKDLKELPPGILPVFSHLQHLATTLNIKGEEAAKLRKLEVFLGSFRDLEDFEDYTKSILDQSPNNDLLAVGSPKPDYFYLDDGSRFYQNPKFNKEVCLINCKIGREGLVVLPNDLNYLGIEECHDLKSLSNICSPHEGDQLKTCYIRNCEGIEYVIDQPISPCNSLKNIEKLQLHDLCNLRELARVGLAFESTSRNPTQPAVFSSLKSLYLRNCSSMKKLCSLELLQGLQNLEEIDIRFCEKIEKIIASEEEQEDYKEEGKAANITFILPKLRKLCLFKLPELKSICSFGVMVVTNSLQHIEIIDCPKLKRIPLSLPLLENGKPFPHPHVEQVLLYPKEWSEYVEWDDPVVKDMLSPFGWTEHQSTSGKQTCFFLKLQQICQFLIDCSPKLSGQVQRRICFLIEYKVELQVPGDGQDMFCQQLNFQKTEQGQTSKQVEDKILEVSVMIDEDFQVLLTRKHRSVQSNGVYILTRQAKSFQTIHPWTWISPLESLSMTLVSNGGSFKLGFFSPGSSKNRYLGIWSSSESNIATPGNLVVKDGKDSSSDNYLWQSFDYPSDTMLPGMKLGYVPKTGFNRRLSAWKNSDDPSPGDLTFGVELQGNPEMVLRKGSKVYGMVMGLVVHRITGLIRSLIVIWSGMRRRCSTWDPETQT
ncbi:hypothetical protein PTKIN_Ptkin14bG0068400 [Pterospermum kingtungense]